MSHDAPSHLDQPVDPDLRSETRGLACTTPQVSSTPTTPISTEPPVSQSTQLNQPPQTVVQPNLQSTQTASEITYFSNAQIIRSTIPQATTFPCAQEPNFRRDERRFSSQQRHGEYSTFTPPQPTSTSSSSSLAHPEVENLPPVSRQQSQQPPRPQPQQEAQEPRQQPFGIDDWVHPDCDFRAANNIDISLRSRVVGAASEIVTANADPVEDSDLQDAYQVVPNCNVVTEPVAALPTALSQSLQQLDGWDSLLKSLHDMGFSDERKNLSLLIQRDGDISQVVADLVGLQI